MTVTIMHGDALAMLQTLPDAAADCCVTSPPYYMLRDYGVAGQIGLEDTPDAYINRLVAVFRELRRVLRDDGTLWLNIGDSYAGSGKSSGQENNLGGEKQRTNMGPLVTVKTPVTDGKPKDLIGVPWRLALALRDDGWYLRPDIIWHKPAPMPESVTDRCTRAHEYIFLLTKSRTYHYDHLAIAEPLARPDEGKRKTPPKFGGADKHAEAFKQSRLHSGNEYRGTATGTRNCRSVWTIGYEPYKDAHFAVFPTEIPRRAILAGCRAGGMVIDPFFGAGTTGIVAERLGRNCIGVELNSDYIAIAKARLGREALPLFGEAAE